MQMNFKGLSRGMNGAVLQMASSLFPTGYDVVSDAEAPHDLAELVLCMAGGKGRLAVSGDYCEDTAFGDPEVNIAFRAWHDWTHYHHRLPFTLEGETAVAYMQIEHLRHIGLYTPFREAFILAEVVDQAAYFDRYGGQFPKDQWGATYDGIWKRGLWETDEGHKLVDLMHARYLPKPILSKRGLVEADRSLMHVGSSSARGL